MNALAPASFAVSDPARTGRRRAWRGGRRGAGNEGPRGLATGESGLIRLNPTRSKFSWFPEKGWGAGVRRRQGRSLSGPDSCRRVPHAEGEEVFRVRPRLPYRGRPALERCQARAGRPRYDDPPREVGVGCEARAGRPRYGNPREMSVGCEAAGNGPARGESDLIRLNPTRSKFSWFPEPGGSVRGRRQERKGGHSGERSLEPGGRRATESRLIKVNPGKSRLFFSRGWEAGPPRERSDLSSGRWNPRASARPTGNDPPI